MTLPPLENLVQREPIVAAVRSYDGQGYYILYPNGAVFSAGDATNYGSANGEVGGFNPASAIFTRLTVAATGSSRPMDRS